MLPENKAGAILPKSGVERTELVKGAEVLAGPVSDQIGISTTLWIGVVWCALSTAVVAALPEIRNVRRIDAPEPLPSGPIPDPAVVAGRPEP